MENHRGIIFAACQVVIAFAAAYIAFLGYNFTVSSSRQERLEHIRSRHSSVVISGETATPSLVTIFFQGPYKDKLTALEVLKLIKPSLAMQLAATVADDARASPREKKTAEAIRSVANFRDLNDEFLNRLELARELLSNGFKAEACEEFERLNVPEAYSPPEFGLPPLIGSSKIPDYIASCTPPDYEGSTKLLEVYKRVATRPR